KVVGEPACYFAYATRPTVAPIVTTAPPGDTGPTLINVLNERSPLGFFDLNFTAGTVYYSPAWKRMLGFELDELEDTYDTWLKLLHPDDTAAAPDRRARGATTGARPFSLEFRMQHAR